MYIKKSKSFVTLYSYDQFKWIVHPKIKMMSLKGSSDAHFPQVNEKSRT